MDKQKKSSLEDYSYGRGANQGWRGVYFLIGLNIALGLMLMAFEVPIHRTGAVSEIAPPDEESITITMTPATKHERPKVHFKPPPQMEHKEQIVAGPVVEVQDLYKTEPFKLQAFDDNAYADVNFDEDTGEKDIDINKIVDFYQEAPEFPGGIKAFYKYLVSEIDYPSQASWAGESGKTHVSFVVNLDGSLTDIQIDGKGISASIDREIIRTLKQSPLWTPGQVNGHNVRVRFTIPITFKLDF